MRLIKLEFSAFGPYADRQVLDFAELKGRRFFLIHGATGAGKTTILDAICFALYGDSSGNLRDGKAMRSDHAGLDTPTQVDFTFALGEKAYRVWRSPEQVRAKKRGGGTTLRLADGAFYEVKAEGEVLLASGYSHATAKSEELLGFKSSQFRQVMLLPQGEFRRLLLANSLERQEIMRVLFKTDLYRQIEENLKEQAKSIRLEREQLALRHALILQEVSAESADALDAQLAEDARRLCESGEKVKALDARRRKARQNAEDAKALQSKFETLAKARAEQEACQKLLPTVDEYKLLYQKAQQAMLLADAERQADAAERELSKRREARRQMEIKAAAAAAKAKAAAAALQKEQESAAEQEALSLKLLELSSFAERAAALQTALAEETAAGAAAREKTALRESAEAALAALRGELERGREKLQALSLEAAKAEQHQAGLRLLKETQENLKRRDEVSERLLKAKQEWDRAEKELTASEGEWRQRQQQARRLQYLFNEGRAAALAKSLQEGRPCPVCGSTAHPAPADCSGLIPGEAEVQAAQEQYERAEAARQAAQRKAADCKVAYDTLVNRRQDVAAALGEDTLDGGALNARLLEAKRCLERSLAAAKEAEALARRLDKLADAEKQDSEKTALLAKECQAAETSWRSAAAVRTERQAALPEAYRNAGAVEAEERRLKERLAALKRRLQTMQQEWQEANDALTESRAGLAHCQTLLEDGERNAQALREGFTRRLAEAGFCDLADYQAAKKTPAYIENLAERIALFDERIIAAKSALKAAEAAVAGEKPPDTAALTAEWEAGEALYNAAFADFCAQKEAAARRAEKQKQLRLLGGQLERLDAQYAVAGTLAEVANGTNSYGLTFQRFVLKSLLDDVLDASNLRLKRMSRGRYMLQGTEERARKNAAGGLDIEIFDHDTGYARPVATLSGGETFLASLSLALGLADVVQSYAGGIRLDTILVDEGFGTLDPEALDSALKTLVDLQKGGRLVGIISHVPELKERIDARLEVTKGRNGSRAAFSVG